MKSSLGVAIVVGAAMLAAAPSWAEVVNVCVNQRTGVMRYVSSHADCRPSENSVSLNSEGPAGSDGIDGIHCWDLNGNRECDPATEDMNADGGCDTADCQGPEGPSGPAGGFDLSKIYRNDCGGTFDDGVRLVECLCDDDGSKAISGAVSCGQFWYPIWSGPYTDPFSGAEGWTAMCKNITDFSQFGPDTLSVICIRP
jgi:hypothetical protein